MRTIGISNRTRYWQHYVFGHPPGGYRYVRAWDTPWHVLGVDHFFLRHTKMFLPLPRVDLYHTYNGIVVNRHPWVIEVESFMPRFGPWDEHHGLYRWGQRRLASKDCKALIFTSQHTLAMNQERLVRAGVDPEKMQVVYRAVERYDPVPEPGRPFTVLFAGNAFYRKGGVELLKAFRSLARPDIRLEIVSTLEVDWGVRPSSGTQALVQDILANDKRISRKDGLPHRQLIERMRRADAFVTTTFADPFNNTVLEAMGCGCPIITSRTSSIPEMVEHGRNGWLVDVKDRDSEAIAAEIAGHLATLIGDRALRQRMAQASTEMATERFDIAVRNRQLGALYDKALAR